MTSQAARYYLDLLSDRPWYIEGMSWTVVRNSTVDEVLDRIPGRKVEHAQLLDGTAPGFDVLLAAHMAQIDADVMVLQQYGNETGVPEVLERLSVGTEVANAAWSISGNGLAGLAVDGVVVAQVDKNIPAERTGDALDEYLDDLLEAEGSGRCAAMLAAVEHATGVRLTEDLLDGLSGEPWQAVMLSG